MTKGPPLNNPHPLGQVKLLPLESITPSPDNPRKIAPKAIDLVAKSITRFGWQQPLVLDKNHMILAGHTRYLAAKQLLLPKVPVVIADNLTPDEARAFRIADNRTGDYTTWDFPELVSQMDDLYDEFHVELALEDWEGVLADFHEITAEPTTTEAPSPTPEWDATPVETTTEQHDQPADTPDEHQEPLADTPDEGEFHVPNDVRQALKPDYAITVICDTAETLADVQETLLDMEGVLDVRYKR